MSTVSAPSRRNGVDTARLFATLDAVKAQPEAARSRIEGDIDLRGILGLSGDVRNGFGQIRVSFRVRGDAPPAELHRLVEQAVARSAVYDVPTHGVPISVDVATS